MSAQAVFDEPSEGIGLPQPIKIGIALLMVYLIWGSTYLALRFAVEVFPPFTITGIRFLTAGLILFTWLMLRGGTLPTRKQWRNATLIGCLMLVVGTGGVAYAQQWVASGLAATAVSTMPIWAAVFAQMWGHRASRGEWLGLVIGIGGVILLNLENGMQAHPIGALVLFIGPISWAFGSMLSRRIEIPQGLMATALEMTGGGAVLILVGMLRGEQFTEAPTALAVMSVLYLITFGSLIAFSAYMYLLKTVRPSLATSYAYVNPVVAVILGAVFAAEAITGTGIAAMIVILTGVALLTLSRAKTQTVIKT
ncbi:MAG: drug/metabolite exporter YedA [Anaerolineae bacterium]|nr:drug/metabolite exporter YedA [Anaerolineae bacterium]